MKSFFDSFKEFTWDIIGYLLPGVYLVLILSVCIHKKFYLSSSIIGSNQEMYPFLFIVICYILGYVIYGFSWLKESLLAKRSYREKIERKISNRTDFKNCKDIVEKKLQVKQSATAQPNLSIREVRNIVMTFFPEADQKIYTFTFRSELSNHIANVSLIIGILGLISKFAPFLYMRELFKTDDSVFFLYILLLLAFFALRYPRNRFYDISIRLPFSMYLAKEIQ